MTFSYKARFDYTDMPVGEVPFSKWKKWCNKNKIPYCHIKERGALVLESHFEYRYYICFENDADLVRFKLTWL